MTLTSARFAGNDRLERCQAGDFSARLVRNTQGDFVALVQQALMDLGEALPVAGADGVYGDETIAAVLSYKTRHGIATPDGTIDGIVGPGTMTKLDEECTTLDETPGPCPPVATGPPVDLGGVDEVLVNFALARTTAATVVGVDGEGATRVITAGAPVPDDLASRLTSSTVGVTSGADPAVPLATLAGALGELATAHARVGDQAQSAFAGSGARAFADVDPGVQLAGWVNEQMATVILSAGTAVRDLSKQRALLEALDHQALGRITLTPTSVPQPDGSLLHPDPKGRFTIGSTVAGVVFKQTMFGDKRRPNYKPAAAQLQMLDIRHVVGLVRLAMFLSTTFGVTEVHHVGISGDTVRKDCHGGGRAIDFVGAAGTAAGTPYTLTVFNDWKNHSVPNLDDRTKPRRPDWPPTTRRLEYRLDTAPTADPFARRFFSELYTWVAGEYQDRTEGPGQVVPASTIGEGSRIMTPDHPDSNPAPGATNGREAHHSHMHWQVGPTGFQAP